jgi:hypothetical protein
VRSLKFTVDREPIDLELGGDHYEAPALLAPAALADLLDMQAAMSAVFGRLEAAAKAGGTTVESGVMADVLNFVGDIFDQIFGPDTDTASRFKTRLLSRDEPFDLMREILPAITALIEEYTGRPTQASSPSSTPGAGAGTPSTDGQPPTTSTPQLLALAGSAT